MIIDMTRVHAELTFTDNPEDIIANRKKIAATHRQLEAAAQMLNALDIANQAACTHPNAKHELGPGSSGSYCDTCGRSW